MLYRDVLLKKMQPFFEVEKGRNMMIDRHSSNLQQGRFYNKQFVSREVVRRDKPFFVRRYNPNELQALIN